MGADDLVRPKIPARLLVGGDDAGPGDLHRQPRFNLLGDGLRDVLDPRSASK
jgi:hypothetical protein